MYYGVRSAFLLVSSVYQTNAFISHIQIIKLFEWIFWDSSWVRQNMKRLTDL